MGEFITRVRGARQLTVHKGTPNIPKPLTATASSPRTVTRTDAVGGMASASLHRRYAVGAVIGGMMNAVVYTLPAPITRREASVITLPTRTKHGLQGVLDLEWPTVGTGALAPQAQEILSSFEPAHVEEPVSPHLPNAAQWSIRLVHGIVEVINGVRPATQLTRWVTPEVLGLVQQRVLARTMPRFCVRSVHVSEPHFGVAEVCSVFGTQNRAFALALRLEACGERWRATNLVFAL